MTAPAPSVVVIGGGLVGLATAFRLLQRMPGSRIVVLEKEPGVGRHQSSHNSGVLHAGLYYAPGSLKARLAVSGIRQMIAFCEEHDVAHEVCGKLVVAAREEEVPRLRELMRRGTANGLRGLEWLDRDRMREIEPHVGGVAAVRVPEEGIADFPRVSEVLAREIERLGGRVVTGAEVLALRSGATGWMAETTAGPFGGALLVNCAGLHCDRIAAMAGAHVPLRIVPFRGEYFRIRPEREALVRHLIYPVPDPTFPFLGVHFTRLVRGGIEAGPNAVLALAREGYRRSTVRPRDVVDALGFPGMWRFLSRHRAMCWSEVRRSFSRERFCAALQRLVPEIQPDDLMAGGAGVRAQAMLPSGDLVSDFHFAEGDRALHVLNAPSPGATASLAIGEHIVQTLAARLN